MKKVSKTTKKTTKKLSTIIAEQALVNAGQAVLNIKSEDRIDAIERAIIQINHFTEGIEKMELITWQAKINTDLGWIKVLLAAGSFSGALLAVVEVIKALKGVP